MENTFRSPRLLYRAPHFPDDEPYFMARQHDLLSQSQSHPGLLKPGSKTGMENHSKWLETCLLAVIVCLPFGNKEKGEDATNKGDGKDGKEAKSGTPSSTPIPIGDITLSGAPPAFAHHRRSEIGIVLLPEWQGMGYGSEAIEWICGWGFRIAGLHRIGMYRTLLSSPYSIIIILSIRHFSHHFCHVDCCCWVPCHIVELAQKQVLVDIAREPRICMRGLGLWRREGEGILSGLMASGMIWCSWACWNRSGELRQKVRGLKSPTEHEEWHAPTL